jgi:hypothetical protein
MPTAIDSKPENAFTFCIKIACMSGFIGDEKPRQELELDMRKRLGFGEAAVTALHAPRLVMFALLLLLTGCNDGHDNAALQDTPADPGRPPF